MVTTAQNKTEQKLDVCKINVAYNSVLLRIYKKYKKKETHKSA